MRPLYTVQELADTLRLQPGTVRNKLSRGEDMPRSVLVGRRRLFPEDAVEAWLRAQEARHAISSSEGQTTPNRPKGVGKPRRLSNAPPAGRGCRRRKTPSTEHRGHSPAQIGLFEKELE